MVGFTFPREEHYPQEMYTNQMVFFADSLRDDILPNPGGAEGVVNMLVVGATYHSAEMGEVVKIA